MAYPSIRSFNTMALLLGLLAMGLLIYPARSTEYSEDAVKAAYLYRFAGYINWPDRASAEKPFIIDVLGAPGIARELRHLVPGHPINGQTALVREISDRHELGNPQIVYVAAGHAEVLRSLSPGASGAAMLLVTDEEGGLNTGSTLNLLTIDHNVRFEVSLTAAQRWGLTISSELLGVAIRVRGRSGQSFLGCGPPNGSHAAQVSCGATVARERSRKAIANPAPRG